MKNGDGRENAELIVGDGCPRYLLLLQSRPEMSNTNRPLVVSFVLAMAMLLSDCKKPPEPTPEPKPVPEQVPEQVPAMPKGQSFVPPAAEQIKPSPPSTIGKF